MECKSAKQKSIKKKKSLRTYTDEEIQNLTSEGYIKVHHTLWDHIPVGAYIRYIKADNGRGKDRNARFKMGGFVRNHFITDSDKKAMTIENKPNAGHASYSIPGYM